MFHYPLAKIRHNIWNSCSGSRRSDRGGEVAENMGMEELEALRVKNKSKEVMLLEMVGMIEEVVVIMAMEEIMVA